MNIVCVVSWYSFEFVREFDLTPGPHLMKIHLVQNLTKGGIWKDSLLTL